MGGGERELGGGREAGAECNERGEEQVGKRWEGGECSGKGGSERWEGVGRPGLHATW